MSQSGSNQYQPFGDPGASLKSGPPAMVNGQSSAAQHIQNGIQTPHFNPTGMSNAVLKSLRYR